MDIIAVWNKEAQQRLTGASLTELAANTAKEYPRSSLGKESVPRKRGHRPHHQACLPPVLQIKKRRRHWPEKRPKR